MNPRIRIISAICAVGLTLAATSALALNCSPCMTCNEPRVEDTLICGCVGPPDAGEVGCITILADVGQSIVVPISVSTISEISALGLDLTFPPELLQYDNTTRGDLTAGFDFFDGVLHPDGNLVRIGGFEIGPDNVPPESEGDLAYIHFTVTAAGCGSFCLVELFDDLASYDACTAFNPTAADETVLLSSWGRVKTMHR